MVETVQGNREATVTPNAMRVEIEPSTAFNRLHLADVVTDFLAGLIQPSAKL